MKFYLVNIFLFVYLFSFSQVDLNPDMKFHIHYNVKSTGEIKKVFQFISNDSTFSTYDTLFNLGIQGIKFDNKSCSSTAFEYLKYNKLQIQFDDKIRESNIFETTGFTSLYRVDINDDNILVQDDTSFFDKIDYWSNFWKVLIFTIIVECIVAIIFLYIYSKPPGILIYVIIVNLITVPFNWLVLPLFLSFTVCVIAGLIIATVFEGYFLYKTTGSYLKLKRAFYLSILMNMIRFGLGMIAQLLLMLF